MSSLRRTSRNRYFRFHFRSPSTRLPRCRLRRPIGNPEGRRDGAFRSGRTSRDPPSCRRCTHPLARIRRRPPSFRSSCRSGPERRNCRSSRCVPRPACTCIRWAHRTPPRFPSRSARCPTRKSPRSRVEPSSRSMGRRRRNRCRRELRRDRHRPAGGHNDLACKSRQSHRNLPCSHRRRHPCSTRRKLPKLPPILKLPTRRKLPKTPKLPTLPTSHPRFPRFPRLLPLRPRSSAPRRRPVRRSERPRARRARSKAGS